MLAQHSTIRAVFCVVKGGSEPEAVITHGSGCRKGAKPFADLANAFISNYI
jgi:hypothetical protein